MNNIIEIVSPSEGFNRGNLFDNYFWPYKYQADVTPLNEKEKLMLKLQIYCFAAHELNLYLDLYPNDIEMIGLYNQYMEEVDEYKNEFESKYGPITLGINEEYNWKWINSPWPWERM